MAITNHERVGKALDILRTGLGPFVKREIESAIKSDILPSHVVQEYTNNPMLSNTPSTEWDVAALLKLMWDDWNLVFGKTLGRAERSLVSELRDCRNVTLYPSEGVLGMGGSCLLRMK